MKSQVVVGTSCVRLICDFHSHFHPLINICLKTSLTFNSHKFTMWRFINNNNKRTFILGNKGENCDAYIPKQ